MLLSFPHAPQCTDELPRSLGFDARFPNQNQTKHCWQNYVDYHKCIIAKGEDFAPCRQVRYTNTEPGGDDVLIRRSSCWPTDPSAPAAGQTDGTSSVVSIGQWIFLYGTRALTTSQRLVSSPIGSTSRQHAQAELSTWRCPRTWEDWIRVWHW